MLATEKFYIADTCAVTEIKGFGLGHHMLDVCWAIISSFTERKRLISTDKYFLWQLLELKLTVVIRHDL